MCAGRESNSGLVRGRDVYYHCTTGADVCLCREAVDLHRTAIRSAAGWPRKRPQGRKLWRNGSALDSRPKGWAQADLFRSIVNFVKMLGSCMEFKGPVLRQPVLQISFPICKPSQASFERFCTVLWNPKRKVST